MLRLKIIDNNTGEKPDTKRIVRTEDWASNLIVCDVDGFFLSEDGQLVLMDNIGNLAICPPDRFSVEIDNRNAFPQKDKYGLTLYTDRVDGFQIRSVHYISKNKAEDDGTKFDIIKWESHEPMEVYSANEKKHITTTESCYSVAFLEWDESEDCYNLQSVGMRLLESGLTNAASEMILHFTEEQRQRMLRQKRGTSK